MTWIAGVVGQPVRHSLSPLLHSAWIRAAGIDADYRGFDPGDEAGFAGLIARGRDGALVGLNVTAPFKTLALAAADEASAVARRCGSANLLVFAAGRVLADSTDGAGLVARRGRRRWPCRRREPTSPSSTGQPRGPRRWRRTWRCGWPGLTRSRPRRWWSMR